MNWIVRKNVAPVEVVRENTFWKNFFTHIWLEMKRRRLDKVRRVWYVDQNCQ